MHLRIARLLPGLLLAACATTPLPTPPPPPAPAHPAVVPLRPAAPPIRFVGGLNYPAQIALPPETEALIEVSTSDSEQLVASTRFALGGAPAPVPFSIEVPAVDDGVPLVLRASFVVNGRKRWRSHTLPVSSGKTQLGVLTLAPVAPSTMQYRCGEMLVGFSPGEDGRADLHLPSRNLVLHRTVTASGVKYEQPDNPATSFWVSGNDAQAQVDGESLPACTKLGAQ